MPSHTTTFDCGLKTVSDILRPDFIYKVPAHQRNFDWSQQVEQLWQDIKSSMEDKSEQYFLGTIVVTQNTEIKERIIIDGQQRLATLSMIFSAIRKIYEENDEVKRAEGVNHDYLGSPDRRTQITKPRLTLNDLNNSYFYKYVNQSTTTSKIKQALAERKLHPSNKKLLTAVKKIYEYISEYSKNRQNFTDALCDIEEFIKDKVRLILWAVTDEADAYVLFETLNDRGLELCPIDLLKNYIFSKAGSRLEHIKQQWDKMIYQLDTQNPTQFLRHFWLSKYGMITQKELYRQLRNKFRTQKQVTSLMSDLLRSSDIYMATTSVEHQIWKRYDSQVVEKLRILKMFKVVQFRPLLLSALEMQLKDTEIAKLIDLILVITMRYNIIGSLNPNIIEREYSNCSLKIRGKDITKTSKIFHYFKSKGMYPDDKAFSKAFSSIGIKKGKEMLSRYILTQIIKHKEGDKFPAIIEDEKKVTLEHIMPSKHTPAWLKVAGNLDSYMDNVNRIGNLTLIEHDKNKLVGRKLFKDKKIIYSNSSIAITKKLSKMPTWDVDQIHKRQGSLSKIAIKVWKFPRT